MGAIYFVFFFLSFLLLFFFVNSRAERRLFYGVIGEELLSFNADALSLNLIAPSKGNEEIGICLLVGLTCCHERVELITLIHLVLDTSGFRVKTGETVGAYHTEENSTFKSIWLVECSATNFTAELHNCRFNNFHFSVDGSGWRFRSNCPIVRAYIGEIQIWIGGFLFNIGTLSALL